MSPVKFTLTVYQQFLFHMWIWRVFHNFNELRIFHKFSRVMNLNLAHSIGNHRCHTAIIVPHNYRLEMGHPRTAGDGAGGEQWRRTRREAGPRKTRNQDGTRIPNMPKGDNIQKRTASNAIRPSIYEFEVLRGLGGATCPPSLCSFTVEHVRGSPPASQLSSAASVPNFSEFGPMAKSLPPNKLQYSFCFHWPIVQIQKLCLSFQIQTKEHCYRECHTVNKRIETYIGFFFPIVRLILVLVLFHIS